MRFFGLAVLAIVFAVSLGAQEKSTTETLYRMPPKQIAEIVDAPPTPAVSLGPNGDWMLLMARPSLPSIDELAQPELRLAGLRIKPGTNGRSRRGYYVSLTLRRIDDLTEKPITRIPDSGRIGNVQWSPDGKTVAFTVTLADHIELWAADLQSARAKRLTRRALNGAYGSAYSWLSDSETLVCKLVPRRRGTPPVASTVPAGPVIQENLGGRAPARTYQDLLKNAHDEALLEYYLQAEVALVPLNGREKVIGREGLVGSMQPSPSGQYLLVETIKRPFSYLVPIGRFPRQIDVWDPKGRVVHTVAHIPLAEEIPLGRDAVRSGPRSVSWRSDSPATLVWTEARDGGDPKAHADVRDELFMHEFPFDDPPVSIVKLAQRFGGVMWGNNDLALVTDRWWKTRNWRALLINPGMPEAPSRVLFDHSWEDRYNDPGTPMMRRTNEGTYVLRIGADGGSLYMRGDGASPEGDRPFLDSYNLETGVTERLWRSEAPYYERLVDFVDETHMLIMTIRESPSEPPNYFVRDLVKDKIRTITEFPHPYPQLIGVQKELIRYDRDDGVTLTATLYLPAGYTQEEGPLPTLMWAYPREFKSALAAGQVRDSPYRFARIYWGSPLFFLTQNYAVLNNPGMPIIGEGEEEPNDTYVQQLVSSAKAAIEELERRGVGDPGKVAIGGHSYGAFMTANLLAHSDLFSAGIARSGAYNRSLTPFGFQAEERTFWQASDTYFAMSPFMHVEKIKEPILLIHGEADNNSGTFPIQSKRLYQALKGLGGTARLVMLPHESHGYRSRESVMHMLWEMTDWLDTHVKNQ